MDHGYPANQGPTPAHNDIHTQDDEPLFTSPPEDRSASMRRPPQQQASSTPSSFGAPPMGEPSEPDAHPDNKTAATQTTGVASVLQAPVHTSDPAPRGPAPGGLGGLGRQPSGSFDKDTLGGGGGGLRRQPSGAYDPSTAAKTDKGFLGGHKHQTTPTPPPAQPAAAGPTPVGAAPGSPYVKTEEVPATGTSPMNTIMENFNKYYSKAEIIAGNVWSHMKTGPSVTDAARGKVSQGIKLVTEGGFEGIYKQTFGMDEGEQLWKTYACYLSTSTGPVAGTLYVSNLKFSFCSDRPLSYAPTPGQQAWSYYKMVVPLAKVKEVIPSFNESKPAEKYIQVATQDGHDFWFMGFVNYDKGVRNMQLALQHIGEIDPNGGLKAPWARMTSNLPGLKKPAAAQQPTGAHNPTHGGPAPNHSINPTTGGDAPYPPTTNPTM